MTNSVNILESLIHSFGTFTILLDEYPFKELRINNLHKKQVC